MKKKSVAIVCCLCGLLLIIVGLVAFIAFKLNKNEPEKLETPQVVLQADFVVWEANPKANGFEIQIDEVTLILDNTATSQKLEDGQVFRIRAVGDEKKYSTSDWSEPVIYRDLSGHETYTITWMNGNTVLETDENVAYGDTPSYDGELPIKDSTVQYAYEFNGWSPQISAVTKSVTYIAQFTAKVRSYTVRFYAEDGMTVLDSISVPYGSEGVYSKSTPVKNATEQYTYIFDQWVTVQGGSEAADLTFITGNVDVYARFKSFIRKVSVYIVPNNSDYGTVPISVLNNVPYGAEISIDADSVIVNGQTVTAQVSAKTDKYSYKFLGWESKQTVDNDTIIVAVFSRELNKYTVIWKNGDVILEMDENVDYGTTPTYNGEIPTRPADEENVFAFSGWTPSVASVTGDITYEAQFTSVKNSHRVHFYDDDGTTLLGVAVVRHGASAIYPNELPTKESTEQFTYTFERWVTEKGGNETANLEEIVGEKNVYAQYKVTARTYLVRFCDYDGTVLLEKYVPYGGAVTADLIPERAGFRFDGWEGNFDDIKADTIIKARYVQQCVVEFVDYDNSIISSQLIDYNGTAVEPDAPTRNNYRFIGWNTGFSNVVSDLVVKAEYVRQYQVRFVDYDGTLLQESFVDEGGSVVPPTHPTLLGYDFVAWDGDFENVTSNVEIKAIYRLKTYTVKFVLPDGTPVGRNYCAICNKYYVKDEIVERKCMVCGGKIIQIFEQKVEHGFAAYAPESVEAYLDGVADLTKIYAFSGWDKDFSRITEDTIVTAVYGEVYDEAVIIVEFSKEKNGDATLYVINKPNSTLNAIEFTITFKTSTGNISIDSVTINSASPFWVEDANGDNNNQYVINNNERFFTFAWSDANGKKFDWCSKVGTFSFSTDGAVVDAENFVVESCNAFVSDEHGENITKIIPVVVYR